MCFILQDIPSLTAEAAKEHPGVPYIVTAPLGLHEQLVVNNLSFLLLDHCEFFRPVYRALHISQLNFEVGLWNCKLVSNSWACCGSFTVMEIVGKIFLLIANISDLVFYIVHFPFLPVISYFNKYFSYDPVICVSFSPTWRVITKYALPNKW